jgi:hypothetical protein
MSKIIEFRRIALAKFWLRADAALRLDPVSLARGLAGDEDSNVGGASIECLVPLAGSDLDSFSGMKNEVVLLNFESELALENEEELARVGVIVTDLRGVRGH